MLFKPHHIEMIKSGIKTETRRNWKRKMAKVGGTYPVQIKMFQPKIECELIKANYIFLQELGLMTEAEANREGGYTLSEFKEIFEHVSKIEVQKEPIQTTMASFNSAEREGDDIGQG